MNRVDPDVYQDWLPTLRSAHSDAQAMRGLADRFGCSSRLLRSEEATVQAVVDAMVDLIEVVEPGDFVFVSFAGHGVTLPGVGDDPDGWDEAWALYDGILLDDEFHEFLAAFPEGVDVLVVTDACFAAGIVDGVGGGETILGPAQLVGDRIELDSGNEPGTPSGSLSEGMTLLIARAPATRIADREVAALVRRGEVPLADFPSPGSRTRIAANIVSLAAASEVELAFEGDLSGLFTAALLEVVDELGEGSLGYLDLIERVGDSLSVQTPSIGFGGGLSRANEAEVRSPDVGPFVEG